MELTFLHIISQMQRLCLYFLATRHSVVQSFGASGKFGIFWSKTMATATSRYVVLKLLQKVHMTIFAGCAH